MRKLKARKKVICAMSGGVDSSVATALLKRAGFDLIGVFMKFWAEPSKNNLVGAWNRCCSPEAEIRARKVAKILKIPFYVLNFEKEFKKRIVDYFLGGYKKGFTPNPCVVCNKEIKFGLLLEKAMALEADYIATGHYAKKQKTENRKQKIEFKLLKGKDKKKDQSYFLWMLNQKQLRRILFPIGSFIKNEVRNLAKKFKLPFFDIPESQEICFIKKTINDFLKKYLKEKPGNIVDKKGKVLGQHQGLWFYTIGQRKGIGLPGGPYYVLDKDLKTTTRPPRPPVPRFARNRPLNLLVVTKNEKDLYKKQLIAKNINWISGKEPKLPLKIKAKIRYRHQPVSATIYKIQSRKYKILFDRPQRAITPGQSVVFYKGQELLGGGIICYNK